MIVTEEGGCGGGGCGGDISVGAVVSSESEVHIEVWERLV